MTLPKDKNTFLKIISLQGDKTLWAIFFILIAISLIEVYSATATLTFKSGNILGPITSHATYLGMGFLCVWIFHNIPCRFFKLWIPLWLVLVVMLAALPFIGVNINDGARWIDIMGIRFQPSEFAKGALIVLVAFLLSTYQMKKSADKIAFKYIIIVTLITCFLIFMENFSTAGILFIVVSLMMFYGRVPLKQLGYMLLVIIVAGALAIGAVGLLTTKTVVEALPFLHRLDNFKARIDRFAGNEQKAVPKTKADSIRQVRIEELGFDINKESQVGHANIAIAKSNIIGCGPGNSRERDVLPQAYSDFIFAIIIEELGLVGAIVIVLLYIILMFRASRIASKCERNFPAFLTLGLASLITLQAAVNMCVAVGLIPVTGQPLPLISRGGSSIIVTSIYFGMMISVSRFAKQRQPDSPAAAAPAAVAEKSEAEPQVVNEAEFEHYEENEN